jgi:hypothetical protein
LAISYLLLSNKIIAIISDIEPYKLRKMVCKIGLLRILELSSVSLKPETAQKQLRK